MNKIYQCSRISLAIIWLYHGLVPKLLSANEQEIRMNNALLPFLSQDFALLITGLLEVVFALLLVVFYRSKILLYPSMVFILIAILVLPFTFPDLFLNAFNPFSINIAVLALSAINIMAHEGLHAQDESR